ncbi:uncharacterized protein LOC106874454 [Octopus bimaculoides]|uniref:uncharacterized protein LOC106874454 n=1 Tax=Octopus bimaculoides TaxID=37653 RepID=UPI00071D6250|nr:uncharacterized protein LOC106874454 [Octopus bimaculoides]|eukprot:XP_014777680.1 PREDICTED: uncharacterized protein LOC106874454 [Octopus bimaculoides]
MTTQYVTLLREANTEYTTSVALLFSLVNVSVEKGVKQGDTISLKLFTVSRDMDWNGGIRINRELLTKPRFADDITLIAERADQLQTMLNELDFRYSAVSLKINRKKTKYIWSESVSIGHQTMGSDEIEEVSSYVYFGQEVTLR